ncbi:MAG TPA: hypothetical protein VGF45_10220, partial [Polyangia bacterium]
MSVSNPPVARPFAVRTAARVLVGSSLALWLACAGKTPAPSSPAPPPPSAGNAGLAPPPIPSEPSGPPPTPAATRTEERRAIVEAVFNLVRDKHYDKSL